MTPNYGYRGGVAVDLDALEAKAKAATKGPWIEAAIASFGVTKADEDFIRDCGPDTVLELIRLARQGLKGSWPSGFSDWDCPEDAAYDNYDDIAASPSPVEGPTE